MDSVFENSKISKDNVSFYNGVRVVNSIVGANCIVGDFSRISHSKLFGYNRIDRNTLIYYSKFNLCSYIGSNSVVMHSEVEKFSSISWGVTIGPGNHDHHRITSHDFLYNEFYGIKPLEEPPAYNRFANKTFIGNDVWVGTNATILNGIKIGDGAVIGANTIVTKDVPPYAIIVGNPGKIIKYRFEDRIIEKLLDLKWWDLPMEIIAKHYKCFSDSNIENSISNLIKIK